MSTTGSKGDFKLFRETLTELERLVNMRDKLLFGGRLEPAIEEAIAHSKILLTEFNLNTSELNAIEELERLAKMRSKILNQNDRYGTYEAWGKDLFDEMIVTKIDFIKKGSFCGLTSKGDAEPMAILERLTELRSIMGDFDGSQRLDDLLESKIRDFKQRPKAKPTAPSTTVPPANFMADLLNVFLKQTPTERDTNFKPNQDPLLRLLMRKGYDKDHAKDDANDDAKDEAKDDDSSTVDGGQLTPTSTIMSENPGY